MENSTPIASFEKIVRGPHRPLITCAPNGTMPTCVAIRKGLPFVYLNGHAMRVTSDAYRPPRFSHDSKHVAWPTPIPEQTGYGVFHDDMRTGKFVTGRAYHNVFLWSAVDTISFSPDSCHLGYIASKSASRRTVVVDEQEMGDFSYSLSEFFWCPDSSCVAYMVEDGKKHLMKGRDLLDGGWDDVKGPVFSPDGRQIVYLAKEHTKDPWILYRNGTPLGSSREFLEMAHATYSGDSKCFLARSSRGGYFLDGEPLHVPSVLHACFRPMSSDLAFVVREGGNNVVVVGDWRSPEYPRVGRLTFSPDGSHNAFVAETVNTSTVVIDGQEGPAYRYVEGKPQFDPTSRFCAYVGQKHSGKQCVVIDEHESPEFDYVLMRKREPKDFDYENPESEIPFTWHPDGTVHAIVLRDDHVYHLTTSAS